MTSSEIRQSFLDFFKSKQHTIVPSSSLMPDSPNLLFTNAGMNQFVPIFLGQVKCPYQPPRAADTQKCIRAGGKHNDLDDVGLDTYHHTFFEMLGNWSFGDYFKKEAIEWAWELVVGIWKFPPQRLYATIYNPDKAQGDPSERDEEAWNFWAEKFRSVGLDPAVHIVNGNKKDNFWMMGETGPCGPCSELHVDLTPNGDTGGALVNKGDARCIEIWNLVFIQFNANPDGTFSPLPAKHVDTGMGFERVTSIIQGTKGFTDFQNAKISNYETDIFRPIFDALEKMSGKTYRSTLPQSVGIATVPVAPVGVPPTSPERATSPEAAITSHAPRTAPQATYYKRRLPHFERPWAKYMVTFSTRQQRPLSEAERTIVLNSLLFGHEKRRYQMYAACVMPDHVHFLFEPQIKEQDKDGQPVFWPLVELLHSIKSFTAHEINKLEKATGQVWENESFDRMIRGDADFEEKFHYICRNPWEAGVVPNTEPYRWLWTPDAAEEETRERAALGIATVPVAPVGVPPTDSSREAAASSSTSLTSHAAGTAARDAQQGDRDGRDPQASSAEQIQIDIAFRVIADHIRTLSFAIADGIEPGNNDRNYVLRRILRRAVKYGRNLGFGFRQKILVGLEPGSRNVYTQTPAISAMLPHLVDTVIETFGGIFPELRKKRDRIMDVLQNEEDAFNKTLDRGIEKFEEFVAQFEAARHKYSTLADAVELDVRELKRIWEEEDSRFEDVLRRFWASVEQMEALELGEEARTRCRSLASSVKALVEEYEMIDVDRVAFERGYADRAIDVEKRLRSFVLVTGKLSHAPLKISGRALFILYDTYGFPLDLTELMARERGLSVDTAGFEKLMEEQRARARAAQKKEVISLSQLETTTPTKFVGFDTLSTPAKVLEVVGVKDKTAVILDTSTAYAEMGGQVGDTGELSHGGQLWRVVNTQKSGNTWLHFIADAAAAADLVNRKSQIVNAPDAGSEVTLTVDKTRRHAIERHHTVTHLMHWALHEVVSPEASQKGSFVGPDKLTFDFNSAPLTPDQVADIEKLVNERILENAVVSWTEVPHAAVKSRKDVMQFFGDKYGDVVRVVQIGGRAGELTGYSMELCGGTHTRATGEIGLFRIVAESAIAAGVRRIEAVAGGQAYEAARRDLELLKSIAGKVNAPLGELEKKVDALLAQQKDLERQLKAAQQKEAAGHAKDLLGQAQEVNGIQAIIENLGAADGDYLQGVADALKGQFKGVVVLGGVSNGAVSLVATVSPEHTAKVQAGKIIQTIAPIVGGKGGGKPDNARGGGKDASKLDEALAKAKSLLG